jgi:hypothetical protein
MNNHKYDHPIPRASKLCLSNLLHILYLSLDREADRGN